MAAQLVASRAVLSSTELVSRRYGADVFWHIRSEKLRKVPISVAMFVSLHAVT
jgi:hypothetical protein